MAQLESLERYGANISASDYDNRTALHIAASEGRMPIVEFLLGKGASVHARDREGNTPLMSAVLGDHHEVVGPSTTFAPLAGLFMTRLYAVYSQIDLLVQCGAHLTAGPAAIGEMLCNAAAKGNVTRLTSLLKARADLSQPDISNRTALHLAVHHDKVKRLVTHFP